MVDQTVNDVEMTTLFNFPEEISQISSAALLNDNNVAVTGHKNGFLAIWNIGRKERIKTFNLGSEIECISVSSENNVLIGCNSGDIFLLVPENNHEIYPLRKGENNKFSRIWRLKWIDNTSFIATSTFGNVFNFKRLNEGHWYSEQLVAHSDSVFGLDFKDNYLATGDYRGLIVIWKKDDGGKFTQISKIRTRGIIQDIKWKTEYSLSAVTRTGHVYYIEFDRVEDEWTVVFDAFVALGNGKSIQFTSPGDNLLAITEDELLHITLPSQQVKKHNLKGGVALCCLGTNSIGIVSQKSIIQATVHDITVPDSLVKYKFAKVSLIGHTGVGKSTLCDTIIGAGEYNRQSTYGKKVWEWKLSNDMENRRVLFHDHGGQETVMYTYLPFITDSDILMMLFKKKDIATFNKMENLIPRIKNFVSEKTKVILVETFIDQEIDEIPRERIERLINEGSAKDCLYVSAVDNIGVDEMKDRLMQEIDWDKAKVVIQSKESENTMSLINELQSDEIFTLKFDEVHSRYNKKWSHISKVHLEFLLRNFSSEGLIEFYPEASDFIIFGGKNYTELRSKIPIFSYGRSGIVSISEIEKEFSTLPEYVKIIDFLFQEYGVNIRNGDLRIFPELLRNGDVSLERIHVKFGENDSDMIEVKSSEIKPELLIKALSELNLQCVDLTLSQGLFRWESNAYLYYVFQKSGDPIRGTTTKFTFYLAGEKDKYVQRLRQHFTLIIENLYGPKIIDSYISGSNDSKKNDEKDYDVAISYASEQEKYVERVADLVKNQGIRVFYAPFEEIDMWGRNIDEYLQETYFSKAKICLMFISKEYAAKEWCRSESRSAFARQREQGLYILPVRFDDKELPGLDRDLHYLEVSKNPPEKLSAKIISKLKHECLI
ncbi:MAG: TIR domain-containing protein [Thermoplasmataceae archaeon]